MSKYSIAGELPAGIEVGARAADPARPSCAGMCMDKCVDMCVDTCIGIRVDMCIGMCVDACFGVCMGMCPRMCVGHGEAGVCACVKLSVGLV